MAKRGRPKKNEIPVAPRTNKQKFNDSLWAFVWKHVNRCDRAEIIAYDLPGLAIVKEQTADGHAPDELINAAMEEFYGNALAALKAQPTTTGA